MIDTQVDPIVIHAQVGDRAIMIPRLCLIGNVLWGMYQGNLPGVYLINGYILLVLPPPSTIPVVALHNLGATH